MQKFNLLRRSRHEDEPLPRVAAAVSLLMLIAIVVGFSLLVSDYVNHPQINSAFEKLDASDALTVPFECRCAYGCRWRAMGACTIRQNAPSMVRGSLAMGERIDLSICVGPLELVALASNVSVRTTAGDVNAGVCLPSHDANGTEILYPPSELILLREAAKVVGRIDPNVTDITLTPGAPNPVFVLGEIQHIGLGGDVRREVLFEQLGMAAVDGYAVALFDDFSPATTIMFGTAIRLDSTASVNRASRAALIGLAAAIGGLMTMIARAAWLLMVAIRFAWAQQHKVQLPSGGDVGLAGATTVV